MTTTLKLKTPCKLKLDASIFILCKFYVAAWFYRKRTLFCFFYDYNHNVLHTIVATPLTGSSLHKSQPLKWRYVHPRAAYSVQAVCQLQSRSRRSVKFSGGQRHPRCRNIEQNTLKVQLYDRRPHSK